MLVFTGFGGFGRGVGVTGTQAKGVSGLSANAICPAGGSHGPRSSAS